MIDKNHKSLEHAETIALLGHTEFEQESGKYTWSAGVYRIMGKSPVSFTPTPNSALELIHPDDRLALAQYRRDVMAGLEPSRKTLRAIRDDGRIIYVEFWSVPIRARDGTITGKFSTLQDVSERRQAETALTWANQELIEKQYSIDQAVIVAITDVKGDITYANDRFCQISGYSREELLGSNHRIVNSEFHSRAFFHDMYRQIASGEVWRGELCNKAKDGSLYWVDTTIIPQLGPDGKSVSYMAIRVDITDRKRGEEELRKTQRFLDSIVENVPLPIVVKSVSSASEDASERRFTLINRAAEKFYGISRDQMLGKNAHEFYSKDHADFIVQHDSEALRADRPILISEHTFEKPNNDICVVTSSSLSDLGDKPSKFETNGIEAPLGLQRCCAS